MFCSRGYYCADCDRHFRSLNGFDDNLEHRHHTDADCRCRTVAELSVRGMATDDQGFWLDLSGILAREKTSVVVPVSRRGGRHRAHADSTETDAEAGS